MLSPLKRPQLIRLPAHSGQVQTASENQDDQNQQQQTDASAGIVAPVSVVWPFWDGPQQHEYKQNDQDRSEHRFAFC